MKKGYLVILALLISFASVGAVVFTPGLPEIGKYFAITNDVAQYTVTWYLIGYSLGQLLYGPLANRFGSKSTLKIGSSIAIIGSLGCILSYTIKSFDLLVFSRVLLSLGAACGLKMTFTLTSKLFSHENAAKAMSYTMMSFAIAPGLAVYIGSVLVSYYNWSTPFYFMLLYSIIIFIVTGFLPEAYINKDHQALKFSNVISNYVLQVKNYKVIVGGLLVGVGTSIVYAFAAFSPFIAINQMGLSETSFGLYNIIPSLGILFGSIVSGGLSGIWSPQKSLKYGLWISLLGVIVLFLTLKSSETNPLSLFAPMVIIYFGFSFIFGNSAALALKDSTDKGNASAMLSFTNMISSYIVVTIVSFLNFSKAIDLSIVFALLVISGFIWYGFIKSE
jgi:MFS transporter, DHA1 family, multidrug resistance protein